MNHAQKMHLAGVIEDYAEARVAYSWKGGTDPLDTPLIEQDLKDAKRALNDTLALRTTNDGERLNLLLDTMLAVSNDMKLPPAGQLVMDAMQGHVANGNIITGDDMKGILDVALTTISIHPTGHKTDAICTADTAVGAVPDHDDVAASAPGNWTPTDERE